MSKLKKRTGAVNGQIMQLSVLLFELLSVILCHTTGRPVGKKIHENKNHKNCLPSDIPVQLDSKDDLIVTTDL